ncbi:MAG: porphobilinogen synthase [Thermoanaerobacterales bacterium]|nr:porphobilinogen synthase [Thermoanaerobacterales bacterium]
MPFPATRLRRLRQNPVVRRMVRETRLAVDDLIYPVFVTEGEDLRQPIEAMPGVFRFSVDTLVAEARDVQALGIPGVIVFGIPEQKDERASHAYRPDGIIQRAVRALKDACPDLLVLTDVCLCEYTSHGHCGVVENGQVLNDPTLELLALTAVSHVRAGADMVAPSDMMDGRVGAIRSALDAEGYVHVPIMAYSAKYAGAFYGPFREAADSCPQFGDRRGYQMDPANGDEALREVAEDIAEGADIVMVKPALAYLDIIRRVKDAFHMPVAAYNVSGEYSMVKAAAARGWLDERAVTLEILTAMKRAGADIILTYHAKDVAQWLSE